MTKDLKAGAAFGVTAGVGGLVLGTVLTGTTGYVAPGLFGGVMGWGVNLAGGNDYPVPYAIGAGAASALVARLVAGLLVRQADLKTEASALTALRRAIFGATLGSLTVGIFAPRFSQNLLAE